jgi:serine O-acetyltransferase
MNQVSAESPDWSREHKRFFEWCPSKSLLASIRAHQRARWKPLRSFAVLRHRFWSVITGAEIPLSRHIGGGLLIPHPNGIVIHEDAQIGPNCLIFQQVTIGARDGRGVPKILGHVDIGAGAKILGSITVGPHAAIGANAVVLDDVPEGATAVGIPARIVSRRDVIRIPSKEKLGLAVIMSAGMTRAEYEEWLLREREGGGS